MTQAVKRACDACHRRKVKCDGINPCRNCSSAQLSCTYNAIPQKKGPKGSRAKVISELRETQRQTSLSAKVQNRMNGIPTSPSVSPSLAPTPGMLTPEVVKDCVDFFFANMYADMPILERRQLEQQAMFMEQDRDTYCLLTSLCAFMMLQPGMTMPAGDPYNLDMMPGANIVSSNLLLEETIRVRKGYEYLDSPSLSTLCTNFFIFGCYYGMELHDKAWYYLREATTMMHMLGMHKEETYLQWSNIEASRRRRLFWLLFVTERAYAIQRHRPLTLQATINPPTRSDDLSDPLASQLEPFVLLVNLFRPLDDATIAAWSKTRGNMSAPYVSALQKQLNETLQQYLCQDAQLTDLNTNQQWLKTTVWQLTNAVLNNNDDGMSFQYPMELARELVMNMASHFPGHGVELLGSGLIEKLIEITCSMADYLPTQAPSRDPFSAGPREYLSQMMNMVALLRHGDYRFLPLLLNKVDEVLPKLVNPMLRNPPENSNMATIDIFDGFGNAGMAQPPPQMQMSIDTDYDRKFSVSDYDAKFSMDMGSNDSPSTVGSTGASSGPPASANEVHSPFVSSPGMLSPGMEFPQNMNEFGLNEMVMSPLGQGPNLNQSAAGMNAQQSGHAHHQMQTLQSHGLNPQHLQAGLGHNGMGQQPNMGGINAQTLQGQLPTSHPMGGAGQNSLMGAMGRQPPQRANSFAMSQQPSIPRTVGDFHALQRANSESSSSLTMAGMAALGGDMDFGSLR